MINRFEKLSQQICKGVSDIEKGMVSKQNSIVHLKKIKHIINEIETHPDGIDTIKSLALYLIYEH